MISSLSINFESKTITIHSVYNGNEVISNPPEKDSDGQICYLEMQEKGRKIWSERFSTDILEAAPCVCAYSPIR